MSLTVQGGAGDDAGSCLSDGLMSLHASNGSNDDSYLSSYMAATYEHGTARCPWHITAAPGQRVELFVLDFSLSARYRSVWSDDVDRQQLQHDVDAMEYCHVYATVRERSRTSAGDTLICARDARETLVYTSDTNSIVVEISAHAVENPSANFLVKFKGTNSLRL